MKNYKESGSFSLPATKSRGVTGLATKLDHNTIGNKGLRLPVVHWMNVAVVLPVMTYVCLISWHAIESDHL